MLSPSSPTAVLRFDVGNPDRALAVLIASAEASRVMPALEFAQSCAQCGIATAVAWTGASVGLLAEACRAADTAAGLGAQVAALTATGARILVCTDAAAADVALALTGRFEMIAMTDLIALIDGAQLIFI